MARSRISESEKTQRLAITVYPDIVEKLKSYAKQRRISVSLASRQLLELALEQVECQKPTRN